ncbi:hypothetical protein GQX74_013381 [Glossina fuscipes]|nr:hypothetical protein GQX74_013381 [Glossina fuscipes]
MAAEIINKVEIIAEENSKNSAYGSYFLEDLNKMRLDRKYCDFTLEVNGDIVEVHKVALAIGSSYFARMLEKIGEAWSPQELEHEWNSRCMGYTPSVELPAMQISIFNHAAITMDNFPSDCDCLLINVRLMNLVQIYLTEIASFESGPMPTNLTGSLGELDQFLMFLNHLFLVLVHFRI